MQGRAESTARVHRVAGTLWRRVILPATLLAALSATGSASAASAAEDSALAVAVESIQTEQLKAHVDYLADDAREGRLPGSPGGRQSADYIAEQFSRLGLTRAGDEETCFQSFGDGCRNVLALLRGRDAALADQTLVVGAHYDHIGRGSRRSSRGAVGQIHNGADDNASGVAGLLELAEAIASMPRPTRRSVLFAAWDAEEQGMLGAKHWVAHPTVPGRRVVFYLNLDMIGRLRENRLLVLGTRSAPGLRCLVARCNPDLDLQFPWSTRPNADHWPLFSAEVPYLMLHTGRHEQYHTPEDDAERIDHEGLRRVTRLALRLVREVADSDDVPAFREAARQETDAQQNDLAAAGSALVGEHRGEAPASQPQHDSPERPVGHWADAPLRLGISWRTDAAEPGCVILTAVVPGSPADRAGLRPGDRIHEVAGRGFTDDAQFAERVKTLPGPLRLLLERAGRLRPVEVRVASPPVRQAA